LEINIVLFEYVLKNPQGNNLDIFLHMKKSIKVNYDQQRTYKAQKQVLSYC